MKLDPWEPDLQSLVARIDSRDLDLQPDFQRGIAWSAQKQQRLIDTVLRGWAVPAVHLLVEDDGRLSVLDGQQRLHAMNEFVNDRLPINGRLEPRDPSLEVLHGLFFSELDQALQRRIMNFKVAAYRLYEYQAGEPYELFFRLNLPTGLTPAEKRNALVGDNHAIVRHLVEAAVVEAGWEKSTIGFSNARLAYDDAIARLCSYLDAQTLRVSMTASRLESAYRSESAFASDAVESADRAIRRLGAERSEGLDPPLNKATLLTWLLVAARIEIDGASSDLLGRLMRPIEVGRIALRRGQRTEVPSELQSRVSLAYLGLFNDRASSRVTDSLSVIARDAAVWRLAQDLAEDSVPLKSVRTLWEDLGRAESAGADIEAEILDVLDSEAIWGSIGEER